MQLLSVNIQHKAEFVCQRLNSLSVLKSEMDYGTGLFVWLFCQAVSLLDRSKEQRGHMHFPPGPSEF